MSESEHKPASGLAIAGLVLGIVAALTSFLPIINNISAFIAVIGGVLAAIALVGANKRGRSKGMPIAGVVLAVVSFVIVLASQSFYGAALRKATEGTKVESTSVSSTQAPASEAPTSDSSTQQAPAEQPAPAEEPAPATDTLNLAVGETATLTDGLSITVNSVTSVEAKYSDKPVLAVNVTYVNNSSENASFNPYDWKGEDGNGAQRSSTFVFDAQDELNSGELSPGGTVAGNIYFEEGVVRLLYYSNMFNKSPTAGWTIA